MAGNTWDKDFWLLRSEAMIASKLLAAACRLAGIYNSKDDDMLAELMFSVSTGMERLLKLLLAFLHFERHKRWPRGKDFKTYGHDLDVLVSKVVELAPGLDSRYHSGKPYAQILGVLTPFAKFTRYYNLDELTNSGSGVSPFDRWRHEVEWAVCQAAWREPSFTPKGIERNELGLDWFSVVDGSGESRLLPLADVMSCELPMFIGAMVRDLSIVLERISVQPAPYLAIKHFTRFRRSDSQLRKRPRRVRVPHTDETPVSYPPSSHVTEDGEEIVEGD